MSALKWITGGLGFVLGGPIGAIIGVGAGFLLEDILPQGAERSRAGQASFRPQGTRDTERNDFTISFLVLIASVIKADGKVKQSELSYVKNHLEGMFGYNGASEAMRILEGMLQQPIPIEKVARQIRQHMDYASRLQLLHLLFGTSMADNEVHQSEVDTIHRISMGMGISSSDWKSIRAMFVSDKQWAYEVLEIDSSASDDEIKKAYRQMAVKYHPDKVSHLGEDYQRKAKEKFQKVSDAFDELKKQRGIV